jgi:hypothetical protein
LVPPASPSYDDGAAHALSASAATRSARFT